MDRRRKGPPTRFAGSWVSFGGVSMGSWWMEANPPAGGVVGDTIYRSVSVGVGNGGEGYDGAGGEISLLRGERK
jgi:hypothetical protein